jgi:hypothetical protein
MQFNPLFLNHQSILAIGKSGPGNYHRPEATPGRVFDLRACHRQGTIGPNLTSRDWRGRFPFILHYCEGEGRGFGKEGKDENRMN